jgi:uncharacterized RDD family membrane protein YckC
LSKYCGSCGSGAEHDDTFCSNCGATIASTADTGILVPTMTATLPAHSIPSATMAPAPPSYQYGVPALPGRFLDPVTGAPLASWGKRLGARLLDGLILGIPTTAVSIILLVAFSNSLSSQTAYTDAQAGQAFTDLFFLYLAVPIVFNLLSYLYYICFIGGSRGQTLGMRIVSIGVRDASQSDEAIGFGRSFMRMMVQLALGILVIPLLIDYLAPLWNPRRQCWHDAAVGSIVVEIV